MSIADMFSSYSSTVIIIADSLHVFIVTVCFYIVPPSGFTYKQE